MTKSLANHTGATGGQFREVPSCEFVHCCIDVQREFCDPEHERHRGNEQTVRISEHIANVAPAFRKAHIPTFLVYFARDLSERPESACGGFFKVKPEPNDVLIPKNRDGAFDGSDIADKLKERGITTLLVSGFNTNACVFQTVIGALEAGFSVWLMRDCVGNDNFNSGNPNDYIKLMVEKGAVVKDQKIALQEANIAINANMQPA